MSTGRGPGPGPGPDPDPGPGPGLSLALAALLLRWGPGVAASGPHSLRYFATGVTEPSEGQPAFVEVGELDGEMVFVRYDSKTQRMEPCVPWMVGAEDPQYWDMETQRSQANQQAFHNDLDILQKRYNQSGGYHTVQRMYGCDLLGNGEIQGYDQYAYDGRDFIALNMDTLTYTAADDGAVITKRKWEHEGVPERYKNYVEHICVELLRKYVEYGKAALERRERPVVKMSRKEGAGFLTLSCRAHGFYPRPIQLTWLREGIAQDMETRRGSVVPNSDGTYHVWAIIDVLPAHVEQYQCRVEHASLKEPGLYSWEPESGLIPAVIGAIIAVLLVTAIIVGVVVWKKLSAKKTGKGYAVAASHDGGQDGTGADEDSCWGSKIPI